MRRSSLEKWSTTARGEWDASVSEVPSVRDDSAADGFRKRVVAALIPFLLIGVVSCDGGGGGVSSRSVINHAPGDVVANQYAAALRSGIESGAREGRTCKVHLIEVRKSFDLAGTERLRSYFVLTDDRGVVASADTCGLSTGDCVAVISRRSRAECKPDVR